MSKVTNLSLIRQYLFYYADLFIPRSLARIPYLMCMEAMAMQSPLPISYWYRNSIREGNFVFGLSDLDVTAMSTKRLTHDEFNLLYKHMQDIKSIYPWLGEINLYAKEDLNLVIDLMNPFEAQRDRVLMNQLDQLPTPSKAQKCVYLLRMLYSDRVKIKVVPHLRQKKWQGHFKQTGIIHEGVITADTIKKVLFDLIGPEVLATVDFFLDKNFRAEQVCHLDTPVEWGYFFPHLYLLSQRQPLKSENEILKQIAIAQMEWEIAGIYTQRHWLGVEDYRVHFEGITKFYRSLTSDSEGDRIVKTINNLLDLNL